MKLRLSDLWSWKGTIDRGPYVVWGVGLAIIKFLLDRFITRTMTGKTWSPFSYWVPGDVFGLLGSAPERAQIFGVLVVMAIPFIWTGLVLTVRRLSAIGMSPVFVPLFFVPVLNLLFFGLLSVLPSREGGASGRGPGRLGRVIPADPAGAGALAMGVTLALAAGLVLLGANFFKTYGWGLFVALPFVLGFVPTVIFRFHEPRGFAACLALSMITLIAAGGVLMVFAIEGLICILMASPIIAFLAIIGTLVGWAVTSISGRSANATQTLAVIPLLMPLLLGAESAGAPEPELIEVMTIVDVDAPPDAVWDHVVSFSELERPTEWYFRTGLAYPMRAEIDGRGVGAVRHCIFSTGAFVEPIEAWDAPRRLAFGVTTQPPAMKELTLWTGPRPPHLDDFLVSRRGEFRLTPLPGGGTRLEGSTWYTNRMWPASYWRLWSDAVIHRIHERVLRHVKRLAEERK